MGTHDEEREHGAEPRAGGLLLLGELTAAVAHELRNTLQLIANDAFLAQQDPAQAGRHLERIARTTRLSQGIVDDVLALANGASFTDELADVHDVLALARDGLGERAIFEDDVPPRCEVRGKAALLARLFHVLYENAVHVAGERRPTIRTRATVRDGLVEVTVEDDGPGVPADVAERVFDPLVTARAGGTGLGLALARRIAEAHGGRLELATCVPATFRVELGAAS